MRDSLICACPEQHSISSDGLASLNCNYMGMKFPLTGLARNDEIGLAHLPG